MPIRYLKTDRYSCERQSGKLICRINNDSHTVSKTSFNNGTYATSDSDGSYLYNHNNMMCTIVDVDKGFTKGDKILACSPPKKKMNWGFDVVSMDSGRDWDNFLKKNKLSRKECAGYKSITDGKVIDRGKTHCHYENKDGIKILTEKPGKDGFLGYVGISFPTEKIDKWGKIREDFLEKAHIKEENPNDNPYISDEWLES